MKLYSIHTGFFKLDGGAMFGVVPKSLWSKTNPPDENNLCTWAMRCLLIEDHNRLILIDNGIGDKQEAKFLSHYHLHGDDSLEKSLKAKGFSTEDVTDMFLTHLHFDHCGGSVKWKARHTPTAANTTETPAHCPASGSGGGFELTFKNATYWSNAEHWLWATQPNAREKPSFLKENILPIKESGQLKFVDNTKDETQVTNEYLFTKEFGENISLMLVRGHTDAMMIPHIKYKGKTIVYMADLLPSIGHIPLPYVMGYDTRPLITLSEKEIFMKRAADEEFILFFEHDSVNECCTVQHTEKGVRLKEKFSLKEYFAE